MDGINYLAILPEMILAVTGIVTMVLIPSAKGQEGQSRLGTIALVGVGAALVAAILQWDQSGQAFFGMVFQDQFGHLSRILFLAASGAILIVGGPYLRREGIYKAEFHCLLLFATVGMCFMATSADLIMTFLGLETLSIATYVLAGFRQDDEKSMESSWKYFLLGAFSTAFMLYGIAFLYGSAGSTRYLEIAAMLSGEGSVPTVALAGIALLLVGFGFKVAMAPFHVWAPDVYQGAPLPVTSHLAVGSKAAAFVALLRVFQQVTPGLGDYWSFAFWTGAVLTMAVGNIAALAQTNIKRLLAYSSVAHAGYLLVGMAANNQLGAQGILFYLISYALMTIGALTVVQVLSRKGEQGIELNDFSGIGFKSPFLTLSLSVFLISMAGIPATAGFMGKLFLFSAAMEKRLYWLVVIAVITSAIGLYYYLRVIVKMYMESGTADFSGVETPGAVKLLIGFLLLGTLLLGLYPGPLLDLAEQAVQF